MSEHYFSRKEAIVSGADLKPLNRAEKAMSKASGPVQIYFSDYVYGMLFNRYSDAIQRAASASAMDNFAAHTYKYVFNIDKIDDPEVYDGITEEEYKAYIKSVEDVAEAGYGSVNVDGVRYQMMYADPLNNYDMGQFQFVSTYLYDSYYFVVTAAVSIDPAEDDGVSYYVATVVISVTASAVEEVEY